MNRHLHRNLFVCILLGLMVVGCPLGRAPASGQSSVRSSVDQAQPVGDPSSALDHELRTDRAELAEVAKGGDPEKINAMACTLLKKWQVLEWGRSTLIADDAVNMLVSGPFPIATHGTAYSYAESLAYRVLGSGRPAAVAVRMALLCKICQNSCARATVSPRVWEAYRFTKANAFMETWKEYYEQTDPKWDFYHPNYETVVTVPGLPPALWGVDPGRVRDPKLRDAYTSALAANQVKVERYLAQCRIHQQLPIYTKAFEWFIEASYTDSLQDKSELAGLIARYASKHELDTQVQDALTAGAVSRTRSKNVTESTGATP